MKPSRFIKIRIEVKDTPAPEAAISREFYTELMAEIIIAKRMLDDLAEAATRQIGPLN